MSVGRKLPMTVVTPHADGEHDTDDADLKELWAKALEPAPKARDFHRNGGKNSRKTVNKVRLDLSKN